MRNLNAFKMQRRSESLLTWRSQEGCRLRWRESPTLWLFSVRVKAPDSQARVQAKGSALHQQSYGRPRSHFERHWRKSDCSLAKEIAVLIHAVFTTLLWKEGSHSSENSCSRTIPGLRATTNWYWITWLSYIESLWTWTIVTARNFTNRLYLDMECFIN